MRLRRVNECDEVLRKNEGWVVEVLATVGRNGGYCMAGCAMS